MSVYVTPLCTLGVGKRNTSQCFVHHICLCYIYIYMYRHTAGMCCLIRRMICPAWCNFILPLQGMWCHANSSAFDWGSDADGKLSTVQYGTAFTPCFSILDKCIINITVWSLFVEIFMWYLMNTSGTELYNYKNPWYRLLVRPEREACWHY